MHVNDQNFGTLMGKSRNKEEIKFGTYAPQSVADTSHLPWPSALQFEWLLEAKDEQLASLQVCVCVRL